MDVFVVALHLLILGSCHAVHMHKRTVDIMKVYIKKNNIQMELIRFRKNQRLY